MYASDFRAKAREILAGKWGMAILTTFVAGLLGGLLVSGSSSINIELDNELLQTIIARIPKIIITYFAFMASIGGGLGVVQFIIGGPVQLGYSKYLLKLHDRGNGDITDLFSEFDHFAEGFLLRFLTGLYTVLWTLLFIIPGIIAAFSYAMAPFILLENPGMRPQEALKESKELMRGHKWELFCLSISFIGWSLLSLFTLGIGNFWLNPYMNASYAAFYRNLCPARSFNQETAPVEDTPWAQETTDL